MAEVMSGNDLTVVVLQPDEATALVKILETALHDSQDGVPIVLSGLLDALGVE